MLKLSDLNIKLKKEKTFFFHYNKPASQSFNKPQISVHFEKTCYLVDNVICKVATSGSVRKTQPKFVMKGKTKTFKIENNICLIE